MPARGVELRNKMSGFGNAGIASHLHTSAVSNLAEPLGTALTNSFSTGMRKGSGQPLMSRAISSKGVLPTKPLSLRSVVPRNIFASTVESGTTSTIQSNFNGTAISAGNYVWFNSVLKPSGISSSTAKIFVRNASITFSANGINYSLPVPDATITFSPNATSAVTSFDTSSNQWLTTAPSSLPGNTFIAGLSFLVPSGGLPGGINPVTWQGEFFTDTNGVSLNWQWAAAVYTQFSRTYGALGVKPVDSSTTSQYQNSDHAGTPEAYKTNVVGGARGGGGSNYTGSYSGTASVTPVVGTPNVVPTANAGPNQTVFLQTTVQLDGTGSTDPDGDSLTYQWLLVSIPSGSTATLTNPTSPQPTFVVDKAGSYTVQLVVNDGLVSSAPSDVVISTKNSPPVANAGANQTATVTATVQLDGSRSSDVDGDPLTYQWSFVSIPTASSATLSDPTSVTPIFVVDMKGTYTVQLIVNDGHVNSAPATVTITTVNSPPVANAGPNQSITVGKTVQLDGSGSTDVDGDSLTYSWSLLSVPAGSNATLSRSTAVKPTFLADLIGTYVAQLVVNDGIVNSTPTTVTISTGDVAPVANAGPAQSVALGSVVNLDGTGSSSATGKQLTYQWSISSKPTNSTATLSQPTSPTPSFTIDLAGNYVIQLIVNDGFLNSQPATVTISTINSVPVANPGPNQTVTANDTVQLTGAASSDADGDPLTYRWAILSQPAGSAATLSNGAIVNPTFVPSVAGLYVIQLIVNEGKVDSPPATVRITVNPQNQPPVVNAGPNQTIILPTMTATLNGSATDDGLPNGTLSVMWSEVSGPAGVVFSSPTQAVTNATLPAVGTYILKITANDSQLSSSAATTVTVSLPPPPVANAGPNQTVSVKSTVQLDGSKSFDPSGLALTYQWSFVSIPAGSTGTLSSTGPASGGSPSFFADVVGTYTVQLVVNNGFENSLPSTVTITVNNAPPVANAGANQTPIVTSTVHLDGSGSTDIDGDPLTYQWSILSAPAGSAATLSKPTLVNPTFVVDKKGTYTIQLVVNDGFTSSPPSTVTISTINSAPVANPGPSQTIVVGNTVQLDGSGSTDVDGDTLTYLWSFVSIPAGSTAILSNPAAIRPTFFADMIGTYTVQLIVNDGIVNSVAATVTITTDDIPPVANPGSAQSVNVGSVVSLDGTGSSSATGKSLTYQWALLSKPANSTAALSQPTSPTSSFTADVAGTYVVQLIVNDGFLSSAPVTVMISTINSIPVANPGQSQTVTAGATVQLSGAASSDADGDSLTYKWAILSQPAGGNAVLSNTTIVNPTFVSSVAGLYVVQLIVNDGIVDSPPVTVTITAQSQNQAPVVNAGPNQTITLPKNFVTLNGSATDDGLPNGTLTINWTQSRGPSGVIFSNPTQQVTVATFPGTGTYVLQLTANDSQLSTSATTTVTVNPAPVNQPPVVSAGPNQTLTLPNTTLTLNGSATDDGLPNGTLITTWSQLSGPTPVVFSDPNQPVTQATFNLPGLYVLQLSANDSQFTRTAQVSVYVYAQGSAGQNQPPFVNAGPDQTVVLPAPIQLNGVAIDDGLPNGTLNVTWSMLSGPGTVVFSNPNSTVTTASFSMAGTYVLTLSASDSALTSSSNVTITVGKLDGHGGYKGTDFWVMFPMNFDNCPSGTCGNSVFQPQLIITSDINNSGTVSIPGINFSSNFTVTAGQGVVVQVPTAAAMGTIDQVENKGIRVTAQSEITLVGLSYYTAATDGYLGLPTPILGTEYLVMAWPKTPFFGSEVGIVAPYDATTVTITPTVDVTGHPARQPYSLILNKGRTYQLISNGQGLQGVPPDDLTGTSITSDKPIAVFGGNQCANIPARLDTVYQACNHVVEELPPTDLWGQNFLTIPIATHVKGEVFRVLAANDGTNVRINGTQVASLNRGEFYQTILTEPSSINADGPALVAQFEPSQEFETGLPFGSPTILGDPSMFLVPSYEQFGGHYTVLTPNIGFQANYVNVVAPTTSTSTITVDGAAIFTPFAPIPGSNYSGAQVPVTPGVHQFSGAVPFGAMLYGLNPFDSYSYQAGLAFDSARAGTTMTLTPSAVSQLTGTQICVIASLYDGFGNPPGGIGVAFTITGANPSSTSVDTNSSGQAQYCYVGTNSGTDNILGSIGTVTSSATITWNANNPNRAPVVFAGNNASITLPATANLYGAVSDDSEPAGATLTSTWTAVSGPGTVTFGNANQPVTMASFSAAGTYDLRLTASDSQLSSFADITVTVNPVQQNQAPVVNGGPNLTVFLPNTATLNGIVSDDGLPTSGKLIVQWSEVSGPINSSPVVFSSSHTAATQAIFAQSGTYVLKLAADDSQLQASATVTVTVVAVNQPPRVNISGASPSPTIQLPSNAVTLNATVTDDGLPAGSTVTSQWTETSGPGVVTFSNPNQASTQAILPVAGTYILTLTANDSQYTTSAGISLTVLPANKPPVVSISPTSQTIALPTNTVALNGTVTDDGFPVGGTLTQTWIQTAGPAPVTFGTPSQPGTPVTFTTAGSYQFQLTASDGQLTTSAIASVTVNPANKPPVVSAGPNLTISLPSNTLTLKGSVTDDGLPAGAAVTSSWSEVSGPASVTFSAPTNSVTNVTFTTAGAYDLRLTASDTQLTSSSDVSITVFPAPQNQPPVVSAGPSLTVPFTNRTSIFLNGSATDDGLPTGSHLTISWTELSGPASCTIFSPASAQTSVSCPSAGTYTFQIAGTDTQLTSTASTTVFVLPPVNQPPSVNAGGNKTVTLPNTLTLNGTVTDDGLPNGTLTIQWIQLTGPAAMSFATSNQAVTQATFPVAGIYQLRLMASDSQLTSTSDISVTVNPAQQPPVVSVNTTSAVVTLPGAPLQLTGSVSDPTLGNGQTLSFQWIETSGPAPVTFTAPNALSTQVTFTVPGSYQLQFSATDGQLTGTSRVAVLVRATPEAPVAALISPADGAELTKPVPIVATLNVNPNLVGSIQLQYSAQDGSPTPAWFNLGTSFTAQLPFFSQPISTLDPTVLEKGVYNLRLVVMDQFGQTSTATSTFVVNKNTQVGKFSLAFTDLTVPVGGLPITITRIYDSSNVALGDFGRGWKMGLSNVRVQKIGNLAKNWNEYLTTGRAFNSFCLQSNGNATVTITFPDGKYYKFTPVVNPQCSLGPITAPTLGFTELPGSPGTAGATLVPADGGRALVDGPVPGPVDLIDFNTNFYNPSTFILTTRDGYRYTIDQQLGVTSMSDPNGNTLTINSSGVTSSTGKSITFVRDSFNRITQITDPDGNLLKYSYNDAFFPQSGGPLSNFTDGANNLTRFNYTAVGNALNATYLSSITDPRGITILTNQYDQFGHLSQTTDVNNKKILYNIDTTGQTETITNRLGNPTTYTYDDDGNILSTKDALGNVTKYTYDINDNKLTETDPFGKTTSYTYDAFGNRLSETDPLGNTTSYTYNPAGQVLTVSDPNGHTTTNIYDFKGNLKSTTDANNKSTSTIYNPAGLPAQVTDAGGNVTKFSYDSFGRLATQTDALNNVTSYTYDLNGNKQSQTVTRTFNGQPQNITTNYKYDGDNRLTETDYADGTKTQIQYNAIGKQSATIDQFNRATSYTYDSLGRLATTTYFDTTTESATYDAENHRLTSTDRNGHTTQYGYDADGRLSQTTYADGKFTKTSYDAAGRVSSTTDANGNVTSYGFDDAGRRTTITDALNHVTAFAYDNAGNQISVLDANQNLTQYSYDELNRQVQVIYPDKTISSTGYDALGRVTSKTDQAGKVTAYGYDKLGRLTSVTQDAVTGGLNLLTQYGYDEVGNRISQTDANGHTTTYQYDQLGRRILRTLPLGQTENYTYDASGNLKTKKDFNGKTTTYAYDTNNRLLSKAPDASFNAQPITFTYFANGLRKTMIDPSGATNYTYDNRNRLTQKQTPEGTLNYTYDNAGNLLSLASANAGGASDTYTYDVLNRLSTVTDASGMTTYAYDKVGNLQSFAYPNGVSTTYNYDTLNRLTQMGSAAQVTCSPKSAQH